MAELRARRDNGATGRGHGEAPCLRRRDRTLLWGRGRHNGHQEQLGMCGRKQWPRKSRAGRGRRAGMFSRRSETEASDAVIIILPTKRKTPASAKPSGVSVRGQEERSAPDVAREDVAELAPTSALELLQRAWLIGAKSSGWCDHHQGSSTRCGKFLEVCRHAS